MTEERETKLREQQDRGARAAIAVKELEGAFEHLEKQCFETFRRSDMHDDVGRRAARYYMRVLDDVRERFRHHIRQGEDAQKELVRLTEPSRFSRKAVNG